MILPLERYAKFTGRSRRTEILMFALFQLLIAVAIGGAILSMGGQGYTFPNYDPRVIGYYSGRLAVAHTINWVVSIALVVPNVSVSVRRLHDIGRSGRWALILATPLIWFVAVATANTMLITICSAVSIAAYVVFSVLMFLEGANDSNRFGANPRGNEG